MAFDSSVMILTPLDLLMGNYAYHSPLLHHVEARVSTLSRVLAKPSKTRVLKENFVNFCNDADRDIHQQKKSHSFCQAYSESSTWPGNSKSMAFMRPVSRVLSYTPQKLPLLTIFYLQSGNKVPRGTPVTKILSGKKGLTANRSIQLVKKSQKVGVVAIEQQSLHANLIHSEPSLATFCRTWRDPELCQKCTPGLACWLAACGEDQAVSGGCTGEVDTWNNSLPASLPATPACMHVRCCQRGKGTHPLPA